MFITVILPCRNEEKTIGDCIRQIWSVLAKEGLDGEIIVSDSSCDGSATIAETAGAQLVRHGKEGYGLAYQEAISRAKGDIIIIGDSDGTYDFREIPKLLALSKDHDIVIGSRLKGRIEKGAMPWHHRYIGNPAISMMMRLLFGSDIRDTQSGFRLIHRKAWERLDLKSAGMEFASEMIIKATTSGLKVCEVPVTYRARHNASQSKLRSFRDGWEHLKFMLIHSNALLFLVPGLAFLLAGAASGLLAQTGAQKIASLLMIFLGYEAVLLAVYAKTYAGTGSSLLRIINNNINNVTLEGSITVTTVFFAAALATALWLDSFAAGLFLLSIQTMLAVIFLHRIDRSPA